MISFATNPGLEAMIDEQSDDPERFLVYADWLQQQGDPRGELIALMLAQERLAALPNPGKRDREKLAEVSAAVQRPLTRFQTDFQRDFAGLLGPVVWHRGFVQRAQLQVRQTPAHVAALDRFLLHPSARFLRELTVVDDHEVALAHLAASGGAPGLRSLVLGLPVYSNKTLPMHDLAAFPRLASLTIEGGRPAFRAPLPGVETLGLHCIEVEFPRSGATPWPAVRSLSLKPEHWGRRRFPEWVQRLLTTDKWLPNLNELTSRFSHGDDVAASLFNSPLLEQFTRLDLTDAANNQVARRLIDCAARMGRLERLYLGDGPQHSQSVDQAMRTELRRVFGERVRFNLPATYELVRGGGSPSR